MIPLVFHDMSNGNVSEKFLPLTVDFTILFLVKWWHVCHLWALHGCICGYPRELFLKRRAAVALPVFTQLVKVENLEGEFEISLEGPVRIWFKIGKLMLGIRFFVHVDVCKNVFVVILPFLKIMIII